MPRLSNMPEDKLDAMVEDIHIYGENIDKPIVSTWDLVKEYLDELFHQGDQGEFSLSRTAGRYTPDELEKVVTAYRKKYNRTN